MSVYRTHLEPKNHVSESKQIFADQIKIPHTWTVIWKILHSGSYDGELEMVKFVVYGLLQALGDSLVSKFCLANSTFAISLLQQLAW